MNITHPLFQVWVFLAKNRFVAVLKKLTVPAIFAVEACGIARQEPLHHRGDRRPTRAKQQMDMIEHEHPSKALGLRLGNDGGKPINKTLAIGIRPKDLPAFDPAHDDRIHRPRCVDSGFPQHA